MTKTHREAINLSVLYLLNQWLLLASEYKSPRSMTLDKLAQMLSKQCTIKTALCFIMLTTQVQDSQSTHIHSVASLMTTSH